MLKRNMGRFVALAVVIALAMSLSGVCFAATRTTLEVVDSHINLMSTMNGEIIASDYAEDCVLITSFDAEPIIGRAGVIAWFNKAVPPSLSGILGSIKIGNISNIIKFTKKEICGNAALLMFQLNPIMHGNESYYVENGLVSYESACMYLGSARLISF